MSDLRDKLKAIDLTKKFDELAKYRIPTGIIAVNMAIGGGIPSGKLTEISGGWSAGKSRLALHIAVETLKLGGIVCYADLERALDEGLAKLVKLDLSNPDFIYPDPNDIVTIQNVFDLLSGFIKLGREKYSDKPLLFVVDSIAAMPTEEDLEKGLDVNTAAARRAKQINQGLRKHMGEVYSSDVSFLCINQVRDRFDVLWGEKEDTPGGKAIKFHASMRMKLNLVKSVKDDMTKEVTMNMVKLVNIKSKVGIPYRMVQFEMPVFEPIDKYAGLLDYLIRHGQIEHKKGSKKYKFSGIEEEFEKKDFEEAYEKWAGIQD